MTAPEVSETISPHTELTTLYDEAYLSYRTLYPALRQAGK
jgi:hypothetical protein